MVSAAPVSRNESGVAVVTGLAGVVALVLVGGLRVRGDGGDEALLVLVGDRGAPWRARMVVDDADGGSGGSGLCGGRAGGGKGTDTDRAWEETDSVTGVPVDIACTACTACVPAGIACVAWVAIPAKPLWLCWWYSLYEYWLY